MNFDLVCCATLRPELLEVTLESFKKKLFGDKLEKTRLIINIDFAGIHKLEEISDKLLSIFRIITKYNFKEIVIRLAKIPNFATAWFWAMKQATSPLVFYLEEDWNLLREVNIDDMIRCFEDNDNLAHLRLSAFKSNHRSIKTWNKFLYWNGSYFETEKEEKLSVGWAGHPGFTRLSFLKNAMAIMHTSINPEKQIKGRRYPCLMNDLLLESDFGVFIKPNEEKQIEDIGRKWMAENGFVKSGNKAFFTNWEKVKD